MGKLKKCPQCSQDLTDEHKKIVLARIKKARGAKRTELKKLDLSLHIPIIDRLNDYARSIKDMNILKYTENIKKISRQLGTEEHTEDP